jgi:hypothetical protein
MNRLFILCFLLLILTVSHHVYGGLVFQTKWRITGAAWGILYFAVMTMLFYVPRNRLFTKIVFASMLGLWVFVIGIYEGGYNHLMKDVLYIFNTPEPVLLKMFPPEFGYVLPSDLFFEITGIIQLVIALFILQTPELFRILLLKRPAKMETSGKSEH